MSGQPTEADIAAMLADALHREFGAFLAHDPHDADRFWGSTARSVAAALRPLLTDTADARVTVAGSGRPSNDRDGACICDYNPETTEGPEEDCPFHGRPYAYWVERANTADARAAGAREDAAWVELDRRLAAEQRLAAVLDVVEMYESCGPKQQSTRDVLAAVRAALAADTVTDTERPLWRCDHWMHDVERCTPTKHYGRA